MADQQPPSGLTQPRVIRVLVSSTFCDMQAERDGADQEDFPAFGPNRVPLMHVGIAQLTPPAEVDSLRAAPRLRT
jgi:hypothetical protein